ncbi:hypothetical protein BD560DRAFT_426756 [Blakeslea trispora]|nr:hypothetical protein BD560DRAFT_426756 [Blakeslea trispora]
MSYRLKKLKSVSLILTSFCYCALTNHIERFTVIKMTHTPEQQELLAKIDALVLQYSAKHSTPLTDVKIQVVDHLAADHVVKVSSKLKRTISSGNEAWNQYVKKRRREIQSGNEMSRFDDTMKLISSDYKKMKADPEAWLEWKSSLPANKANTQKRSRSQHVGLLRTNMQELHRLYGFHIYTVGFCNDFSQPLKFFYCNTRAMQEATRLVENPTASVPRPAPSVGSSIYRFNKRTRAEVRDSFRQLALDIWNAQFESSSRHKQVPWSRLLDGQAIEGITLEGWPLSVKDCLKKGSFRLDLLTKQDLLVLEDALKNNVLRFVKE